MQPTSDRQSLSYVQKPTAAHRWRWRVVFAALAVTIGLLAWTRGPALWDRARVLYWQRQCLNFSLPADQVVYDNMPADPVGYLAAGGIYLAPHDPQDPNRPVGRMPECWTTYCEVRSQRPIATNGRTAILFLGERTTDAGEVRLVVVSIDDSGLPGSRREPAIAAESFEVVGWRERPMAAIGTLTVAEIGSLQSFLQIYAGQPDPADPARFTIRFKRTEDGLIEGRLAKDGSVDLRLLGSKSDGFATPLEGK